MFQKIIRSGLFVGLLGSSIAMMALSGVNLPTASLDSSWMFAINEAVAQRMAFGRDIVFTFGPYAAIYTGQFHEATAMMCSIAGGYLALGFTLFASYATRSAYVAAVLLILALPFFRLVADPLFTAYPLYFAVAALQISMARDRRNSTAAIVAIGAGGLGLIVLIKGSFIPFVIVVILLSAFILLLQRMILLFWVVCLSPFVVTGIAWTACGQVPSSFLPYLAGVTELASGYSEAMSSPTSSKDLVVFGISAVLVLRCAMLKSAHDLTEKLFIGAIFGSYLFIAFKSGFIRADGGHVPIAIVSVVAAAFSLPMLGRSRHDGTAIGVALVAFVAIGFQQSTTVSSVLNSTFVASYEKAFYAVYSNLNGNMIKAFNENLTAMKAESPLPVLDGKSDIYQFSTSVLLSSGNQWSPRPIFQSYSAYTPDLQRLNKAHLSGANSPDHIFFRVEEIDDRLPSTGDGPSWIEILSRYSADKIIGGQFLLFNKNQSAGESANESSVLTVHAKIGERIQIPKNFGVIKAKLKMSRTFSNKLMIALYKPPALFFNLVLRDGSTRKFRFVPGSGEIGFILSPLLDNVNELLSLALNPDVLIGKSVDYFEIIQDEGAGGIKDYELNISEIALPFSGRDKVEKSSISSVIIDPSNNRICSGYIDAIDSKAPASDVIKLSNRFDIRGWLADDVAAGTLPSATFVTLTGNDGAVFFIRAKPTERDDVATSFDQPGLKQSGFQINSSAPALHGAYKVGLALETNGKTSSCSNIEYAVELP